eukprot:351348-Chlamydomonas_euryale.AAC.5
MRPAHRQQTLNPKQDPTLNPKQNPTLNPKHNPTLNPKQNPTLNRKQQTLGMRLHPAFPRLRTSRAAPRSPCASTSRLQTPLRAPAGTSLVAPSSSRVGAALCRGLGWTSRCAAGSGARPQQIAPRSRSAAARPPTVTPPCPAQSPRCPGCGGESVCVCVWGGRACPPAAMPPCQAQSPGCPKPMSCV